MAMMSYYQDDIKPVYIYLQRNPQDCVESAARRNRSEERSIPENTFALLHMHHENVLNPSDKDVRPGVPLILTKNVIGICGDQAPRHVAEDLVLACNGWLRNQTDEACIMKAS